MNFLFYDSYRSTIVYCIKKVFLRCNYSLAENVLVIFGSFSIYNFSDLILIQDSRLTITSKIVN